MKKDSKKPIILLSELNFLYDLSKTGEDILESQVHIVLRADLLAFLKVEKRQSIKGVISSTDYKAWIDKIHNRGLDFHIVLKNDLAK